MTTWERYLIEETAGGRHKRFPLWSVSGEWEFVRDDGLMTAHKMESPHSTWRQTVEWSMQLADEKIPLHAELPAGMRHRGDPNYFVIA